MKENIELYIKKCIENDREAQLIIYQMFSPVLYGLCLKYMQNEDDAKDAFQEAFVIAFQKMGQYKFEGSFEGWLKRIFINKLLQTIKRKKKNGLFLDAFHIDLIADKELEMAPIIGQKVILEYIQELPNQCKMVFNLFVFEKMKHKEIAMLLQISEGTSKSNLNRAKNILKKRILVEFNCRTS